MRRFLNIIKYDVKEGSIKLWYLYLLEIGVVIMLSLDAVWSMKYMDVTPSALEIWVYIFQGIAEYVYVKGGPPFEIPVYCLIFSLTAGLFVVFYPVTEWKQRGYAHISRYGSKKLWWLSKCVWCLMQTVFIFLTAFLTVWVVAACNGNLKLCFTEEAFQCFMAEPQFTDIKNILLYGFIMLFCTVLALNQCIVTLQMIANPVVGYLILLAVNISSAFYNKEYFIGNSFFLVRSRLFEKTGNCYFNICIYGLILYFLAILIGQMFVKRKDIL